MSGKKAKKARRINRLRYVCRFLLWLEEEPPVWCFLAWRRWKKERPEWSGRERTRSLMLNNSMQELREEYRR